jgi:ABC-2 type transport system ATP-binding protein
VLLLDEPTVGVDPQSRNHIFESIAQLGREGLTLIYTTHYMEEAERLCDRVAIMDKGKILANDRVENLIREHGGPNWLHAEFSHPPDDSIRSLMPGIEVEGTKIRFQTDDPLAAMEVLRSADGELQTFHLDRPDLESVFLNLTGKTLRDS